MSNIKIYNTIKSFKDQGLKVGLTTGCFDIIHAGHITFLSDCKKHCDKLIVAVSSDTLVKKTKGSKRPILSQQYRLKVVKGLNNVDEAFINNEFDSSVLVDQLGVDIFFKGRKIKGCELENVARKGIEVKNLQIKVNISTTDIIKKIKG